MNLNEWAEKWRVPDEAVADLHARLGKTTPLGESGVAAKGSEAAVQVAVRLEASRKGARLWRNNVGVVHTVGSHPDDGGTFIRYGLANSSSRENKIIKSSDLIGLRPVRIEHGHVGRVLGVFVAREIKAADWRYTGNDTEKAQLKFLEIVLSLGGDAAFAVGEGTF